MVCSVLSLTQISCYSRQILGGCVVADHVLERGAVMWNDLKISTWWLISTPITKYNGRGQTFCERCPGNTLWWPSFLPAIVWFGFHFTKHSESCFCRRKLHYRCHLLLIRSDIEACCEVRLGCGCSFQSGLGMFRSIFVPEKLTCSSESVLWVRWQKMMLIRKNRRERVSSYATPANSSALSHVTISHIWIVVVVSGLITPHILYIPLLFHFRAVRFVGINFECSYVILTSFMFPVVILPCFFFHFHLVIWHSWWGASQSVLWLPDS